MSIRTVLIGARGYVGEELIEIISHHPYLELIAASSRELEGKKIPAYAKNNTNKTLFYSHLKAEQVAQLKPDLIILALPNGLASSFVDAIDRLCPEEVVVLDLSADYRFNPQWHYGLPEVYPLKHSRRISNPGCYATAIQLSIAPVKEFLAVPASCFGVSGYSGAGTKPSDKNNTALLKNNLMPYQLIEHIHEKEVSHHLQSDVKFSPHVAEFFRGINVTTHIPLNTSVKIDDVLSVYQHFYHKHSQNVSQENPQEYSQEKPQEKGLINVQESPPQISQISNKHGAIIGGFALSDDGKHLALNCVLDNLLKGAATQAIQNINIAFQLPELMGITISG